LVSPPKKGPAAFQVSEILPEVNLSIIPTFNLGLPDKAPARALIKAVRKWGKKKEEACFSCCSYCF
jgi:hypothetical protein